MNMKPYGSAIVLVAVLALAGATVVVAEGADGKALYDSKCAMCHGKDGVAKPMAKGSQNLNDAKYQEATTAEAIATVVAKGKGKMKGYEDKLKADEITAIAAHVKTLR